MENINLIEIRNQLVDRKTRIEKAIQLSEQKTNLISLLQEVDFALERMNTGTYGICEVCHETIEEERLKIDPLTRFCLDHLTSEQQKILEQDLGLAYNIQKALLPKNNITTLGWEIDYRYEPAGLVSGDYCDIVEDKTNGSQNLFFIIGDVSGKGFASSMLMTHMHAMFHSLITFNLQVNELVERANRLFCESTTSSHYATLVCIKADKNGNVEICNAGHFHPLIIRKNHIEKIDSTGFPLGLFCNAQYSNYTTQLLPGDIIFLYTDGLIETRNGEVEFGIERTINFVKTFSNQSGSALIDNLLDEVSKFNSGSRQADDLTLMVIKKK